MARGLTRLLVAVLVTMRWHAEGQRGLRQGHHRHQPDGAPPAAAPAPAGAPVRGGGLVGLLQSITSAIDSGRPLTEIEMAERCYQAHKARRSRQSEDSDAHASAAPTGSQVSLLSFAYFDYRHRACRHHRPIRTAAQPPAPSAIDVVYTWVNGTDPTRAAQLKHYTECCHKDGTQASATANRFRSWDELRASLRLTYKHAEHLGRVIVVTAGERPHYGKINAALEHTATSRSNPTSFAPYSARVRRERVPLGGVGEARRVHTAHAAAHILLADDPVQHGPLAREEGPLRSVYSHG